MSSASQTQSTFAPIRKRASGANGADREDRSAEWIGATEASVYSERRCYRAQFISRWPTALSVSPYHIRAIHTSRKLFDWTRRRVHVFYNVNCMCRRFYAPQECATPSGIQEGARVIDSRGCASRLVFPESTSRDTIVMREILHSNLPCTLAFGYIDRQTALYYFWLIAIQDT